MTAAGKTDNPDSGTADLAIAVVPLPDTVVLAGEWQALERRAEPSFFLSWAWIGCWLRHLPPSPTPLLLRATPRGRTVALGIVVPRTVRHGIIRSRGLHVHETGRPDLDVLTIEYNGLLLDRRATAEVEGRCFAALLHVPGVDEVHLSGVGRERLAS